jgi:hypothetical protein
MGTQSAMARSRDMRNVNAHARHTEATVLEQVYIRCRGACRRKRA